MANFAYSRTWSCNFFIITNVFCLNFSLAPTITNGSFFESLCHDKHSMTVILIYNEVFWEISSNNFNHFFPTFGSAEFVYILRQCYQFAFLYCKIGQISTLIFGQNLRKSPQRRSTVFPITKINKNFMCKWTIVSKEIYLHKIFFDTTIQSTKTGNRTPDRTNRKFLWMNWSNWYVNTNLHALEFFR